MTFTLIGSTWTPAAGHFETLTLSGNEYTVTEKDQTELVFEDSGAGRLKRITIASANRSRLTGQPTL